MRRVIVLCGLVLLFSSAVGSVFSEEPISTSLVDQRRDFDRQSRSNPYALTTYKANYFLLGTYNFDRANTAFGEDGPRVRNPEVKFQISLKITIGRRVFNGYGDFAVGYTQQSYWQAYRGNSTPFRETVYEPEPMLTFDINQDLGWFRARMVRFSFDHQSNGRFGDLSRSWNRLCTEALFERGNLYVTAKPWVRIPDSGEDDNPGIVNFVGNGELNALYVWGENQFGLTFRNNFSRANKGSIQLDWNYPLYPKVNVYVQYFDGYGENLIDYNHHNRRIGLGVLLANWL